MTIHILTFLQLVTSLCPSSTLPLLLREDVIEGLCQMLTQQVLIAGSTLSMVPAIASLLLGLVGMATSLAGQEMVFSALHAHWDSFMDTLRRSLAQDSDSTPCTTTQSPTLHHHHHVSTSCLRLLQALLLHRFRPPALKVQGRRGLSESLAPDPTQAALTQALQHLLDGDPSREGYEEEKCCGGELCGALLKVRDCSVEGGRGTERGRLATETLAILLACSSTAKKVALDGGVLELSLEQIKILHAKLCIEILDHPYTGQAKKKESPFTMELVVIMNLLRNFMYQSDIVKHACFRKGLAGVLHKLWPCCTVSHTLIVGVVNLLNVYTARHSQGRLSLASPYKGSPCFLQDILKHTSHTLTSYYSCVKSKVPNPHGEILSHLFTLLANTALSQECRAIFKKTNFLMWFSQIHPKKEKVSSVHQEKPSTMWLRLLVNLSFFPEGQFAIIRTPGILTVLLDIYGCGHPEGLIMCLLILRNLSFHSPSKALLTSNKALVDILMSGLESNNLLLVTLSVSALWSLSCNNSKARFTFKALRLKERLKAVSVNAKQLYSAPPLTNETGFLPREQCVHLSQKAFTHLLKLL